jgi:hypothetical protein
MGVHDPNSVLLGMVAYAVPLSCFFLGYTQQVTKPNKVPLFTLHRKREHSTPNFPPPPHTSQLPSHSARSQYGQLMLVAIWVIGYTAVLVPLAELKYPGKMKALYGGRWRFLLGIVIHVFGHILNVVGAIKALTMVDDNHAAAHEHEDL